MGYSSWNDCASEITEERIKNVTSALIATGLAAKGYIHVNVDEGWCGCCDANRNGWKKANETPPVRLYRKVQR